MKPFELDKNVHRFDVKSKSRKHQEIIYMLSDLHLDNPKTDRKILIKHLNKAKEEGASIHLNGDTFCLMQGAKDRRGNKSSIMKQHLSNTYIDDVIDEGVEFWKPYAENLSIVTYGNHETGIIKHLETDPVKRFVDKLNLSARPKNEIQRGGYGGWIVVRINEVPYRIKYFHGSGGGGIVTRGEINLTRMSSYIETADCITIGHIHENKETWISKEVLNQRYDIELKDVLLMVTGTYKEEYANQYMGWHVERGAPPKPIGGRKLILDYHRGTKKALIKARSIRL